MNSIAFISGKGGVGKSIIALNLAYLLSAQNTVLLMDCDMGLANLDILAGITHTATIQDGIINEKTFSDIAVSLSKTLTLLPSASGMTESTLFDKSIIQPFLNKNKKDMQKYSFTLFDLASGVNATLLAFMEKTKLPIIIMTPEPTSIADTYALIKVLHMHYGISNVTILINMAHSEEEASYAFTKIETALQHFLSISAVLLGSLASDSLIMDSVQQQIPFVLSHPHSTATKTLENIATTIVSLLTQ
ncbi:MAG: P-loop NTPase [Desulfovibrionaceae bacterium]